MNEYCSSLLDFVKEFQTLITGLLALTAALFTIYFLRKQIKQTEKIVEDQHIKSITAARAVLPIALSELCEFYNKSGHYIILLLNNVDIETQKLSRSYLIKPFKINIDTGIINIVKENIDIKNNSTTNYIFEVMQRYQVILARIKGFETDHNHINSLNYEYILSTLREIAEAHAYTSLAFTYGRDSNATPAEIPNKITAKDFEASVSQVCASDWKYRNILQDRYSHIFN